MVDMDRSSFYFCDLLTELCREERIELTWLSNFKVAKLCRGQERHYIVLQGFELNSATAAAIANDKYATFCVLNDENVPVIEHTLCYGGDNSHDYAQGRNTLAFVQEFFDQHEQNIVLKPNSSCAGKDVYHITKQAQLAPLLQRVCPGDRSASLCPFYNIVAEYRVIWLDDAPRLIYQKQRQADWRFNLSNGAKAIDVTDAALRQELVEIARAAVAAISLRFCSVDIIQADGQLLVLEVNSGVTSYNYLTQYPERYPQVQAIYRDALRKLFHDDLAEAQKL